MVKNPMNRLLSVCVLLLSVCYCHASTGVIVEAITYTKPVGDKLFVMLGDSAAEEKATAKRPELAAQFRELRAKYLKSGLYEASTSAPLWQLPDQVFSPIDGTYLSDDGRYLVRIEGDWWRTKDFPGGRRPEAESIEAQLSGTAVSFFDKGKLLKSYFLKDLLQEPARVMHSPQHLLWYASGSLNQESGKYLLFTQDAGKVVFDYRTGEVLSRSKVGLSNPIFNSILIACAVSSGLILLIWIYFVFIRGVRRTP